MSSVNEAKLDLKLSSSPPRPMEKLRVESQPRSEMASLSSCVSSDEYCTSPEATSMVLVGCPQCLMYIILSEEDLRCPICKTTVLLHVIHENKVTKNTTYSSKS